jgi:anti-anti-sigma regulatory factor
MGHSSASNAFSLGPYVDSERLAALEAEVAAAAGGGVRDVSIDLVQLVVLDEPVIKALIRMLRSMREFGGRIHLTVGRKAVRETLRVTGLDNLFLIVERAA